MRLIVIFSAAAIAVLAFWAVYQFSGQKGTSTAGGAQVLVDPKGRDLDVKQVNIMVAKREIPIGTKLTAEDLDTQPWPSHLKLEQFISSEDASVVGMVTRAPFLPFEPLISSKLANPNDPSFIAAALPAGMRATTISIDAITGVAGFVFPGDRVDVLITQNVLEGKSAVVDADLSDDSATVDNKNKGTAITEVLAANVRVLAVDQKSSSGVGEAVKAPSSVTIEVSQKDAQKIRLAEKSGMLSLSLRSLKDINSAEVVRPTGAGDLSRTTPPSFFPVLYGFNDDTAPVAAEGDQSLAASNLGTSISIVRGSDVKVIEVKRP